MYQLCKDASGSYYCSPLPCDQANSLQPPYHAPPVLALLADVAYVEYGTVPLYYLGPCTAVPASTAPANLSCGAYAAAKVLYADGRLEVNDMSSGINVLPIVNCASGGSSSSSGGSSSSSGNVTCSTCPLDMLHVPQKCPPGVYSYR